MKEAQILSPTEDMPVQPDVKNITIERAERAITYAQAAHQADHLIEVGRKDLENAGMQDSEEYFNYLAKQLTIEWNITRRAVNDVSPIYLHSYPFEDVKELENCETYQHLYAMRETYPENFNAVSQIVDAVKEYYDAIAGSNDPDIVVIYDEKYRENANRLCNKLEDYRVNAFDITNDRSYSDPRLLCSLRDATLMVLFCASAKEGEEHTRTKQFKNLVKGRENSVLFVVEKELNHKDGLFVSLTEENWQDQIDAKAAVLINGAASCEEMKQALKQREELIDAIRDNGIYSPENIQKFKNAVEKQIVELENFATLYGRSNTCRYDADELEDLQTEFFEKAEYRENQVNQWLAEAKRNDSIIKAIVNNKKPFRFYERFKKLDRLVDKQKSCLDKLVPTHDTIESLKNKLDSVLVTNSELNRVKREYKQAFKETILEKYMRPFERLFDECITIASINTIKIDRHMENFKHFEDLGIYVSEEDGLKHPTRGLFEKELSKKRTNQEKIDSAIERITKFEEDVTDFIHDYNNPTFNPNTLRKQASELTELIKNFRKEWGLPLEYKKAIYGGDTLKICYIKFTDENLLQQEVEKAIKKHNTPHTSEEAKRSFDMGAAFMKQYEDATDPYDKKAAIQKANDQYIDAAKLGHAEAWYILGRHAEKGIGFAQSIDMALDFYTKAAESNHARAQVKLGKYYESAQNIEKALKWYQAAAERQNFDACLWMFDHYVKNDDLAKAISYYEQLSDAKNAQEQIVKMPENRKAYMGQTLYRAGKYDLALEWLNNMTDLKATIMAGDCYYCQKKKEEAIAKYRSVNIESLLGNRKLFVANGIRQSEPGEALKYYALCESTHASADLYINIGDCQMALGQPRLAIAAYEKALALDPNVLPGDRADREGLLADAEKLSALADLYQSHQKFEKAIEYYSQVLEKDPSLLPLDKQEMVADLFCKNDQQKKGIELYSHIHSVSKKPAIAKKIADELWKNQEQASAIKWYETYAAAIADQNVARILGYYYFTAGNNNHSQTSFASAAKWFDSCARNLQNDQDVVKFMVDYHRKKSGSVPDAWCQAVDTFAQNSNQNFEDDKQRNPRNQRSK